MKTSHLLRARSAFAGMVGLLIPCGASAALISYEGFQEPLGNLSGQQGTGWDGPWTVPGVYIGDSQIVSGSLNYPSGGSFTSQGNQLAFSGSADRSVNAAYGSDFQYQTGTDAVRYASVLINTSLGHYLLFQPSNDAGRWSFGINGSNQFLLRTHDGTSLVSATSSALISANTTYLLISKLVLNADNTQTVYMSWYKEGDAVPTDEPLTWMLSATATNTETTVNTRFTILRGGSANPAYIDELRLGTTWQDVAPAPIPEPGSVVLLGLAATLGAWQLRRKA